ncbi:hypothetical protein Fmac_016047 [Flemingia macrophylla]|uniref:Uncharacterized protein n=1 Tax=Flemingia macrophylla TaxID=520843 RepID=A0ABD1MGF9_9FABA
MFYTIWSPFSNDASDMVEQNEELADDVAPVIVVITVIARVLGDDAVVDLEESVMPEQDEVANVVEAVDLLGGAMDGDVTDADLGRRVGAELLNNVSATVDDAAYPRAEAAEDGVIDNDEGGERVVDEGVAGSER